MIGKRLTIVGLLLTAIFLAGCDKCGNRITLDAPSLPKACGDNANPNG